MEKRYLSCDCLNEEGKSNCKVCRKSNEGRDCHGIETSKDVKLYILELIKDSDSAIRYSALGFISGSKTSEAKINSSRENGKKGGRPRTRPLPDPNVPKRPRGRPRKNPITE